jgi:hypothetical protein
MKKCSKNQKVPLLFYKTENHSAMFIVFTLNTNLPTQQLTIAKIQLKS